MKITQEEIFNNKGLPYLLIQPLHNEGRELEKRGERLKTMAQLLYRYINQNLITDTEQVNEAIAWVHHSDKEPIDILEMILKKE